MNYLYKEKVRKYIIENFPLAIEISNIAPIFLIGGALRDIELLTPPKDLDFVVLSDTDEIIKTFIEKNNLKYKINKLGGYKIYNNTVVVDLWNTNDLLKSIEYNIEGLFYDIKNDYIIPFGYYDALENGLRIINPNNNINEEEKISKRKITLNNYIKNKINNLQYLHYMSNKINNNLSKK